MPKLNWISDKELSDIVSQLLDIAKKAKAGAVTEFGKNVIDPFSSLFEMSGFDMSYDEWIKSETARQAQKTLQNHIGDFHQKILGSCKGWANQKTGNVIDLVSKDSKIVAEIKNKYNTLSGGKLADMYKSLEYLVMQKASIYKGYTAYYVTIIPKKPGRYDKEFIPSDKEKGQRSAANKQIREIDGASFYSIVTKDKNALENLFDILPLVISEVTGKKPLEKEKLKAFFKSAYG